MKSILGDDQKSVPSKLAKDFLADCKEEIKIFLKKKRALLILSVDLLKLFFKKI